MYSTIAAMAHDEQLRLRIAACAAQEGERNPTGWAQQNVWNVVAGSDWESAYQYALDTSKPDPGNDQGVITDPMILSSVQARRAD